ncbi:substrate-binding domain-containing protein [Streptomyces sp. WM6386]|uniref:substrate-binding domain-containing protein n=1 Tax=Streptomyces sp. WM6386 TaxID=1415558 RepID=UPI000A6CDC06|nr:substrate-binding domain-containing protein [Streptomyces sp. WM6386]
MAVFADSNHQRLGINRAAASLGLRLPDDVSAVGFGDLPFVDWVTARLTTVRTPLLWALPVWCRCCCPDSNRRLHRSRSPPSS